MNISILVAHKISDCKVSWDALLPNQHHLKSKHLLALENAKIDDLETIYVQVFLRDKLIGIVYLQQLNFKHKHINFSNEQLFLSKIISLVLPRQLPILVCGHLFRIDFEGFYFPNPEHKIYVFDAIKLFRKQNEICKTQGIIIKDCKEVFVMQQCNHFGYQFFDGDVTMELMRRENWISFGDYLNDLSKKYLQRAKKILKSFESLVIIEFDARKIKENENIINNLYNNVVAKQSVKLGTINAKYFIELKNDLESNFEFQAIYKNNEMIGFYTFIIYEKHLEIHFIGLDYEANKEHQIYFNILFLGIQKLIQLQLTKLELGRTARDAKANVGAQPKQIINYVFVNNWIMKFALNYFLKSFNENESKNLVPRSPLK